MFGVITLKSFSFSLRLNCSYNKFGVINFILRQSNIFIFIAKIITAEDQGELEWVYKSTVYKEKTKTSLIQPYHDSAEVMLLNQPNLALNKLHLPESTSACNRHLIRGIPPISHRLRLSILSETAEPNRKDRHFKLTHVDFQNPMWCHWSILLIIIPRQYCWLKMP